MENFAEEIQRRKPPNMHLPENHEEPKEEKTEEEQKSCSIKKRRPKVAKQKENVDKDKDIQK